MIRVVDMFGYGSIAVLFFGILIFSFFLFRFNFDGFKSRITRFKTLKVVYENKKKWYFKAMFFTFLLVIALILLLTFLIKYFNL